jgi:hypothetical protein
MTPEHLTLLISQLDSLPVVEGVRQVPETLVQGIRDALVEFEEDKREWVRIERMQ